MGKGSMLYKAVKMPHNAPVKVAGYSTLARQIVGLYMAEYSPRHGRYRLVDNCNTNQTVYHTKQIKSFRNRFQPCFRARRGRAEAICKYLFLYIFVRIGFCTSLYREKVFEKFLVFTCYLGKDVYNDN